jgi:ribosomal protein L10
VCAGRRRLANRACYLLAEWTDLRCTLRDKKAEIKVLQSCITRRVLVDTKYVALFFFTADETATDARAI